MAKVHFYRAEQVAYLPTLTELWEQRFRALFFLRRSCILGKLLPLREGEAPTGFSINQWERFTGYYYTH